MKKKFELSEPIAKEARKFKTLNEEHVIVLLAFTGDSAVLYKKDAGGPVSVVSKGVLDELETITPRALISIAKFPGVDNFAIVINAPNKNDLIVRPKDGNHRGTPMGAILLYGVPGLAEIHVRIIFIRSSSCTCDSLRIDDKSEVWMIKSIVEPILICWGLKFSWEWFFNSIFECAFTSKCELEYCDEA